MKNKNKGLTEFKIWSHKYDFSEINKFNYHKIIERYFKLTTKKVTLLAMILTLNIISAVISKLVLTAFYIGGFLTITITFWTIMLSYLSLGFFYTFIFLELTIWFRFLIGNTVIDLISFNISDLTFLIIFSFLTFLINYIRVNISNPKNKKTSYYLVILFSSVIAILSTSGMDVLYNNYFLIGLYYKTSVGGAPDDLKPLLIIVFWFNILQYGINFLLFSAIYNISYFLIDKYE